MTPHSLELVCPEHKLAYLAMLLSVLLLPITLVASHAVMRTPAPRTIGASQYEVCGTAVTNKQKSGELVLPLCRCVA